MRYERAGPGVVDRGPLGNTGSRSVAALLAFGIALTYTGCSGVGDDAPRTADVDSVAADLPPEPVSEMTFRGMYTFGHEVRAFRPCGSATELWVRDQTGLLRTLHEELRPGAEPYEEIFVFAGGSSGPTPADGFGADYDGELVVTAIRYAAREGLGCSHDWSFTYRAAGNEPFWSITVDEAGLHLARPGEQVRTWAEAVLEATHGNTRITVPSDTAIDIELRVVPCRDSMSGAFSSLTATLRIQGRVLTGCAVPGESAPAG